MKCVVQRVSSAKVWINGAIYSEIQEGILVLVAVKESDNKEIMDWMANKLINLRIFEDENQKMNLSVKDLNADIMIVSNFTVYGDTQKGLRPSYTNAASPNIAKQIYDDFVNLMSNSYHKKISTGIFAAMMDIEMTNSGPVTLIIEK